MDANDAECAIVCLWGRHDIRESWRSHQSLVHGHRHDPTDWGVIEMTQQELLDLLDPADREVMGVHQTRTGFRVETLDTQAGMRAYYKWRHATGLKNKLVVCGECNNGTRRFFVRVKGIK